MAVKKGVSGLISYTITALVMLSSVAIITALGFPLLERSTGAAEIDTARKTLEGLDDRIRNIASLSKGSSTQYRVSTRQGKYVIWPGSDTVRYRIETDSNVVSTGGATKMGAVYMSAEGENPSLVTVTLNYSSINLTGDNQTINRGSYRMAIENTGGDEMPAIAVTGR